MQSTRCSIYAQLCWMGSACGGGLQLPYFLLPVYCLVCSLCAPCPASVVTFHTHTQAAAVAVAVPAACWPVLQPDHLEALASGTQLQSLSLCVYQVGLGGSSRVQFNPLFALTNLRSLELAYRGEPTGPGGGGGRRQGTAIRPIGSMKASLARGVAAPQFKA